jgi:hypothetical protein
MVAAAIVGILLLLAGAGVGIYYLIKWASA